MTPTAAEVITVPAGDDIPGGIPDMGETFDEGVAGLIDALDADESEDFEDNVDESEQSTGDDEDEESEDDDGSDEDEEDEDEESEESEEDESEEDESEDGDEADDEDADLIEVTLPGGEKKKVTREEAAAGYSRTEDYTRKRQVDAEEHRVAMSEVREVRSQYGEGLEKLQAALSKLGPQKPDAELRKSNPGEYAAQLADYQAFQETVEHVEGAREALSKEEQAEQQAVLQAHINAEWEKVVTAVPEWQDEAVAVPALAELKSFGMEEYSFAEQEIESLSDARLLLMLKQNFDLKKTRKKGKKVVEEKKKKATKRLGAGSSQPRSKGKKGRRKAQAAADQLAAETGSVKDAARAIEMLLDD